jgi:hypothetical protein
MEEVLDVYTRPHDPEMPLVCLDETSKQLVSETRTPVPMKPGQPERIDYEYERNGTATLFMLFAPLEGFRHVEVTDHRKAVGYAKILKDLSDVLFPHARKIALVQDNLNTHVKASLYAAFPPAEARRIVERFEWHYTPRQLVTSPVVVSLGGSKPLAQRAFKWRCSVRAACGGHRRLSGRIGLRHPTQPGNHR